MNKEENIQKIQEQIDKVKEYLEYGMPYSEYLDLQLAFDDIVNLIQKQNKIIDKFSKALVNCVGTCPIDYNDDFENDCENCQDTLEKCWIEFFKKEVEKNVKNV